MRTVAFRLLAILVFMIPWENAITIASLGTLTRATGIVVAAFWIVTFVVTGQVRRPHAFHAAFFVYLLWNIASAFWSFDIDRTLQRIITSAQLAILTLIIWDLCTKEANLNALLQAYVLGSYVCVGSDIYNYVKGVEAYSYSGGRYTGAGLNADDLALILSLGMPIAWYLATSGTATGTGRILRAANLMYIPLATLAILLTASRMAVFTVVPAFVFIVGSLTRLRLSRQLMILVLLIGALGALVNFIPPQSINRLATIGGTIAAGDMGGRVAIWRAAIATFSEYPVWGVGGDAFRSVAGATGSAAHNSFLSVLVELGLVGFVLFAIVLWIVLREALRQPRWQASLWSTILVVWLIGVSALTWEARKPTWLVLTLVVVSASLYTKAPSSVQNDGLVTELASGWQAQAPAKARVVSLLPAGLLALTLFGLAGCSSATHVHEVVEPSSTGEVNTVRASTAAVSIAAFPGAEGFGAGSVGGRSGRVIEVTNLNDHGPGSLRSAIDTDGPRIVVFRTGGTINLQSSLQIKRPFITIAGQTAPGGGITLRNVPSNKGSPLEIFAHDVIIRYLRSRPGPPDGPTDNLDAIEILGGGAYNVIIDHCSFSWSVDEVASVWWSAHDITLQWSIIAEGLNCSVHPKGCHSTGLLLGSDGSHDISIHHNLFAHNDSRNRMIKVSGVVDSVNNVIYNPAGTPVMVSDEYGKAQVNVVGNYFQPGADTEPDKYLVGVTSTGGQGIEIFVMGNITSQRPSNDFDNTLAIKPQDRVWHVPNRHSAPVVPTTPAFDAYDQVLAAAGTTKPERDAVDQRIVNDVIHRTGHIIDNPSAVGGWPGLAAGTPPTDTDHDGMPDRWEQMHGLDPLSPSDGPADADGNGYTNVEEYLNQLTPGEYARELYLPLIVRG